MRNYRKFYVYLHFTKDTNTLFYIGKGTRDRAFQKGQRRSMHWRRIVDKHGVVVKLYAIDLTDEKAKEIEIFLIKKYGIERLCNMTIGGDGMVGYISSDATRKKLSDANLKHYKTHGYSDERRKNATIAAKKRMQNKSIVKKISNTLKEYYSKEESRKKTSVKTKQAMSRPDVIQKMKDSNARVEVKLKRSISSKKMWENHEFKKSKQKPVYSETLKACFPSLTDAKHYLIDIGYTKALTSKITEVCQNKRRSAYGKKWEYIAVKV